MNSYVIGIAIVTMLAIVGLTLGYNARYKRFIDRLDHRGQR